MSTHPYYMGKDKLIYVNISKGNKLYLKSSTGIDEGRVICENNSYYPCYTGNWQIVYRNNDDGGRLYLKKL